MKRKLWAALAISVVAGVVALTLTIVACFSGRQTDRGHVIAMLKSAVTSEDERRAFDALKRNRERWGVRLFDRGGKELYDPTIQDFTVVSRIEVFWVDGCRVEVPVRNPENLKILVWYSE